jgi:hypothetical protein
MYIVHTVEIFAEIASQRPEAAVGLLCNRDGRIQQSRGTAQILPPPPPSSYTWYLTSSWWADGWRHGNASVLSVEAVAPFVPDQRTDRLLL